MRFFKYFVFFIVVMFLSNQPFNKALVSQNANASYDDSSLYIQHINEGKYELLHEGKTEGKVSIEATD